MLSSLIITALIVAGLFVLSQAVKHPKIEFSVPARRSALPPCAIHALAREADLEACEAIYRLNEPDRFPEGSRSTFVE